MHNYPSLVCATALVVLACADPTASRPREAPIARSAGQPGVTTSVSWAQQIVGQTGPGSTYGIFVPADWNGDAIFYAHGIVDVAAPVVLPTGDNIEAIRDALGAMGYAVAYSSFSSNGFDVDDGVRRTHQLRGLFDAKVGRPTRSYLVGQSLGSLVAEELAERYAGQYDGAFLACGPLGGAEYEFNYIGNVRLLFDFFYPGVLPGTVDAIPNVNPFTQIVPQAQAAIGANPAGAVIMTQIDQIPLGGASLPEKFNTLVSVLVAHSRFVNDLLDRVHGHFPFSNDTTVYSSANSELSDLLGTLNTAIKHYSATPDARAYMDRNYQPSGAIQFPVLTMHTNRDYFVPIEHETRFAKIVAGAGNSDLLAQRTIDAYGHCAFTVQQVVTGFTDLANWVVNGVKP